MEISKKSTGSKIYWMLLVLSVIVGVLFYSILKEQFSLQFLILFSGIPFFLFVIGVFGLLWPMLKPTGDEVYIWHALLIGLLFIVLFFIHTWVVLPLICPSFADCLGL